MTGLIAQRGESTTKGEYHSYILRVKQMRRIHTTQACPEVGRSQILATELLAK